MKKAIGIFFIVFGVLGLLGGGDALIGAAFLIIGALLYKSASNSNDNYEDYSSSSRSSSRSSSDSCNHDFGEWYDVAPGHDSYQGRDVRKKRACKKCGFRDIMM